MSLAIAEMDPMRPVPYRVTMTRDEIPGCRTITVEPAEPGHRFDFQPGQFFMIYAFGQGEVPVSVSDASTFTIMTVGPVSAALCALSPGAMIGLRGPYGSVWPVAQAAGRDVVVMAGGLGLAPLRPAILHLVRNRASFGRVCLLYGARRPEVILFEDQLDAWRNQGIEVAVTVDHAERGWRGPVGAVTELVGRVRFDPANTLALACGPEVMMRFSAQALLSAGVAAKDIFVSMERNMKCAIGLCGHCQFGPTFVCKDGPVMTFDRIAPFFAVREI